MTKTKVVNASFIRYLNNTSALAKQDKMAAKGSKVQQSRKTCLQNMLCISGFFKTKDSKIIKIIQMIYQLEV